jgi:hypothetical protein
MWASSTAPFVHVIGCGYLLVTTSRCPCTWMLMCGVPPTRASATVPGQARRCHLPTLSVLTTGGPLLDCFALFWPAGVQGAGGVHSAAGAGVPGHQAQPARVQGWHGAAAAQQGEAKGGHWHLANSTRDAPCPAVRCVLCATFRLSSPMHRQHRHDVASLQLGSNTVNTLPACV